MSIDSRAITKMQRKKLKVLSISSLYPHAKMPNYGIFVANRLRAMHQTGDVEITLITPHPGSFAYNFSSRHRNQRYSGPLFSVDPAGFPRYHVPTFSIPGFFKSTEEKTLTGWLKKNASKIWVSHGPFDVIDVHWGYPDLPAAKYLSELWGLPLNFTLRGMETFYPGDFRECRVADAVRSCSGIISLSNEMLKHAQSIGLSNDCMNTVVINGSDPKNFTFKSQKETRELLGIPQDQIVLIGVGSLILRKGFQFVINAISELKNDFPELNYYILGSEGPSKSTRDDLEKLSILLGVKDRVHFVGAVPNADLGLWYNASDWFVLSSAGEGSPNVLSESLMSGCPAISTPVGAVADIMSLSSHSGVIFPEISLLSFYEKNIESEKSWTETIRATLSSCPRKSPSYRQILSDQMSFFTWGWCAEKANEHLRVISSPFDSMGKSVDTAKRDENA